VSDLDANEIIAGLWQGSMPMPGDRVARAGFLALVLCAEEYQPAPRDYPGVAIIYAPNDDTFAITEKQWKTAVRAGQTVAGLVGRRRRVLVTCQMGLNRSGLVSALAVRELTGCSGLDAATLVQNRRRKALCNTHFVEMLAKLPARSLPNASAAALLRRRLGS